MTSEANIFTINPKGFKVHWKITADTTEGQVNEMITRVNTLVSWLGSHEYCPDDMGRSPGNGGSHAAAAGPSATPSGKASKYKGPVFGECPNCNGDLYDNRKKKDTTPSWRGPWFKCKDEDGCGWATFKTDGTEGR